MAKAKESAETGMMLSPETQKQVALVQRQVAALVVQDDETEQEAISMLGKAKAALKRVEAEEELILGPQKQAVKATQAFFGQFKTPLEEAELMLKGDKGKYRGREGSLWAYNRQKEEEARAEQERIAKREAEGKLKPQTAQRLREAIEAPKTTVSSEDGSKVQYRDHKEVVIDQGYLAQVQLLLSEAAKLAASEDSRLKKAQVHAGITFQDAAKFARYLITDDVRIRKVMLSGADVIPGVTIKVEKRLASS